MLPREKMSEREVESGDSAQEMLDTGWTKKELLDGHPGEEHWHRLPVPLKIEWQEFVDTYERAGTLDGPCFWFDLDTRRCMHHEYRPQVCRDFQTGSKGCREWRSEYRTFADRLKGHAGGLENAGRKQGLRPLF